MERAFYILLSICLFLFSCRNERKLNLVEEVSEKGYIEKLYSVDKNGNKEGFYTEFYPDGDILSFVTTKDNRNNGVAITFFENGHTKALVNYVDGKKENRAYFYYPNGSLKMIEEYENDSVNGKVVELHSNGKIKHTLTYKKGHPYGSYYKYESNGNIKEYGYFDYYGTYIFRREYKNNCKEYLDEGDVIDYWIIDTIVNYDTLIVFNVKIIEPPNSDLFLKALEINILQNDTIRTFTTNKNNTISIVVYNPDQEIIKIFAEVWDTLYNKSHTTFETVGFENIN